MRAPACNPTVHCFVEQLRRLHPDDAWQAYRWAFKSLARKYGLARTLAHWHTIHQILEYWEGVALASDEIDPVMSESVQEEL